jgi:hypothetical protein
MKKIVKMEKIVYGSIKTSIPKPEGILKRTNSA